MAIAVMTYHYMTWRSGEFGSGSVLGKLGVYAVATFYVLSGLSLSLVYFGRMNNLSDIRRFAVKRIFRIFPLYYLVVTASLLFSLVDSYRHAIHFQFPWRAAVLNYSLLFGFVDPTAYLSTGAWSIGNEMVFYSIFPFLLLFSNRLSWILPVVLAVSVALEVYFAFRLLSPDVMLEQQWQIYINPFNQLFLFLSGVVIGAHCRPSENPRSRIQFAILGLACIIAFASYPAAGDLSAITTGPARLTLSIACIVLVLCVYVSKLSVGGIAGRVLGHLGESCYSIYLLHPLIAMPIVWASQRANIGVQYAYTLAFATTLVVSRLTFKFVEAPMMKVGQRWKARDSSLPS